MEDKLEEKKQLRLALAVLRRAAMEMSPDALTLAVGAGAHDVGVPYAEARKVLAPLFETQQTSVHNLLFGWTERG